jgi:hypothetical protein
MGRTIIAVAILLVAAGCTDRGSRKAIKETAIHEVVVKETMNAAGYTYLLVSEGRREHWIAVSEMDADIGATYYYQGGLTMTDFRSRELDTVFKSVIFVDHIGLEPPVQPEDMSLSMAHSATIPVEKLDISVEAAQNGITVAELLSGLKAYDGKTVRIRGQVTKFNADIMDKNWIHIQDGTEHDGQYDLTITSSSSVEPGDILTFEGKITLDKDFGFGYFYEVLMEEASIVQ